MLSDIIGACFLVATFALCVLAFRLVRAIKHVLNLVDKAANVVAEIDLDDREKERAIQALTFKLLGRFAHILLGGAMCVIVPLAALWGFDELNWLHLDSVLTLSLSWQFITATTVIFVVFWMIQPRISRKETQSSTFENSYSSLDKVLHKAAFASRSSQIGLAKLEDILFPQAITKAPYKPVFITALPRAGTTLLLDLLSETGEFCTHTYRQMPFLLIPMLWEYISKRFKSNNTPRERAHGDGMLVSIESPEAFEEVIWYSYWQKHYQKKRIQPWAGKNRHTKFDKFYRHHISKTVYLGRDSKHTPRYISKNNLKIARIPYLKKLFPDAIIIVPIRDPLEHSCSLWNQHQRFSSIHREDDFARRYMRDVGHFDFGENLKPINFSGDLPRKKSGLKPDQLGFWLEYWLLTYTFLLERKNQLQFFDYNHFCSNRQSDSVKLGKAVEVNDLSLLQHFAERVSPRESKSIELSEYETQLLAECRTLHSKVCGISLNHGEAINSNSTDVKQDFDSNQNENQPNNLPS